MIDLQSLSAAAGAISTAKDIASAALGARDSVKLMDAVSTINTRLIEAQDGLIKANLALMNVYEELLQARREAQQLKNAAAQQNQHTLVMLSEGVFVYVDAVAGLKIGPQKLIGNGYKALACYCQNCFDAGRKAGLFRAEAGFAVVLRCPNCRTDYPTGEGIDIAI